MKRATWEGGPPTPLPPSEPGSGPDQKLTSPSAVAVVIVVAAVVVAAVVVVVGRVRAGVSLGSDASVSTPKKIRWPFSIFDQLPVAWAGWRTWYLLVFCSFYLAIATL